VSCDSKFDIQTVRIVRQNCEGTLDGGNCLFWFGGNSMSKPEISGIAPFFIVRNVPAALSFYRDRLGFDITFQGPEPDDIFFGIVRRGVAMIMFKDVGVDPVPNYTRDIKKGIAR